MLKHGDVRTEVGPPGQLGGGDGSGGGGLGSAWINLSLFMWKAASSIRVSPHPTPPTLSPAGNLIILGSVRENRVSTFQLFATIPQKWAL